MSVCHSPSRPLVRVFPLVIPHSRPICLVPPRQPPHYLVTIYHPPSTYCLLLPFPSHTLKPPTGTVDLRRTIRAEQSQLFSLNIESCQTSIIFSPRPFGLVTITIDPLKNAGLFPCYMCFISTSFCLPLLIGLLSANILPTIAINQINQRLQIVSPMTKFGMICHTNTFRFDVHLRPRIHAPAQADLQLVMKPGAW